MVDAAVQAVHTLCTAEAAVQAALDLPHPDHGLPGHAGPPSHLAPGPAAQAGSLPSTPNFTSVLLQLRQPFQVRPGIPQLDGGGSNMDDAWTCKCCRYARTFPTEELLGQHHNEAHDEFEECNICYSRHVWT